MNEEDSPVGSQRRCRFVFCTRKLTPEEQQRFKEGLGLPAGVGYDPTTVKGEYEPPEEPRKTLEGASIVRDGQGEYHFIVSVTRVNVWRWRGVAFNGEGEAIGATRDNTFRGVRTF